MEFTEKVHALLAEWRSAPAEAGKWLARLKHSPRQTIEAAGVEVPPGKNVVVLEDTDAVAHAVLPHGRDATEHAASIAERLSTLPEHVELRIKRDTRDTVHVVLPPPGEKLDDAHLKRIVG